MKRRIAGILMALTVFVSSVAVSAGPEGELTYAYGTESVSESDFHKQTDDSEVISREEIKLDEASSDMSEEIPDISQDKEESSDEENENQEEPISESSDSDSSSEENLLQESDQLLEEAEVSEEPGFTVFSEENADLLKGESEEDKELIQEIEDGQVLAFSPAISDEAEQNDIAEGFSASENDIAVTALKPGEYYVESGARAYCDEVWTEANDFVAGNHTRMASTFRLVHYIDDAGTERTSPLYCLKATKTGVDNVNLKEEAVKVLKNATIQKLLYFGHGGPGDLGTSYDPSCSHINWSRWQNRYMFTHIALSKVYSGDKGYATEAEVEHVGINKLITKVKAMTIPARNKASVSVYGDNGWTAAGGQTVPMSVFRFRDSSHSYVPDSMKDGFQLSALMKVTDAAKTGNGIIVTRASTEKWQLAYWDSGAEYNADKTNPTMMKGTRLKLKEGAYFLFIFPLNTTASKKFQYKMMLQPVSYLLVDGKTQTGKDGMQDFGAYVYQGTRGLVTFTLKPAAYGSIKLTKTEVNTAAKIEGAQYSLYAAEIIKSGYRTKYQKDQKITSATTDSNGVITFTKLAPGKYYIKETKAPAGYLLSAAVKNVTVTGGKTATASVKDEMDIHGTVSITKKDGDTKDMLAGAQFTLYEWSKTGKSYKKTGKLLKYDSQKRIYTSDVFYYSEDNQGKFRVKETKAPAGYTGTWQKDIRLTEPGTNKKFSFEVLNYQTNKRKIEIVKTDADKGDILENAEFTLYEYSAALKGYKTEGVLLKYDRENQLYTSEELLKTADNKGRFRVVETKNPPGYEGTWEKEADITDEDASLFYEVTNTSISNYTGTIRLRKSDIYTGELLEGAEFTVYQWNAANNSYEDDLEEKSILKYNSDTKEYCSDDLPVTEENQGKFRIVETENPENYTGIYEKEIVFEKKENTFSDEIVLNAENTPDTLLLGTITIIKKIREEDITWAHGNPSFFFVAEGKDLTGASHKYEDYVTFVPDSYEMDDNGYATLAVTLAHVPLGQYEIWEKPVLRYYLKDAYANTENVSITKGISPSYGADPKQVAKGTAVLTAENGDASITFVNEKSRYDGYSHNDCIKNTIPLLFPEKE